MPVANPKLGTQNSEPKPELSKTLQDLANEQFHSLGTDSSCVDAPVRGLHFLGSAGDTGNTETLGGGIISHLNC